MSGVLARYAEEVRVARESERKMKERAHKLEKKIKEQDEDVQRKNKLLAKLKSLVDDKSLPERDELSRQLAKATEELETASEKLKVGTVWHVESGNINAFIYIHLIQCDNSFCFTETRATLRVAEQESQTRDWYRAGAATRCP
jgi:hypothetical protein